MTRHIPDWEREIGRSWRLRRRLKAENGYMVPPEAGRRLYVNLARGLPRLGAFISLDAAAEFRRAGQIKNAGYALQRAAAGHAAWVNKGGYLP